MYQFNPVDIRLFVFVILLCVGTGVENVRGQIKSSSSKVSNCQSSALTIYVFLSPECPACQTYVSLLNKIDSSYHKDSLKLIGVVSGKFYSNKDIREFTEKFSLNIPLWIDTNYNVSKKYRAKITPEVVLVDRKSKVLYQGAIDNHYYSLGKRRQVITEHYLLDAINQRLKNEKVLVKRTTPVGCLIE